MKIEEVAYAIAGETIVVLEEKYHYRIPEEHKRDIQRSVQERLNAILASAQGEAAAEPAEEEPAEEE